ncbi:MAG TPA: hypothetical protein VKB85_10830 [Propionibacteriaceae bacterium]|nr:hypothetical protein [Propionibacteriaceae bacterium]
MSNPNDPNGAQGSDQGSSGQTPSGPGQSPSGYGQNPGGYDQNPTGGYGQNPTGYDQNPTGAYGQNPTGAYGQNPTGGYDQNASGYGRDSGSYAPAPYGQGYSAPAGDHPQGTTILVLGIVGIFFTICAPIAWYLGSRALKEIRASGMTYNNQQQIVIGRTLGIIFSILAIIGLVLAVFFVIIAVVTASQGAR